MARAPLPANPPLLPFFVLRWDADFEQIVLHVNDEKRSSYVLGVDLFAASQQLVRWGIDRLFAERAVDAAREFRAVQAIPAQDRVINLIPRSPSGDVLVEQFRAIESEETNPYASLL